MNDYTLDQRIPILDWYIDDTFIASSYANWKKEYVGDFISRFNKPNILRNLHGSERYPGASEGCAVILHFP
jgi:hypothetical protein